MSSKLIQELEKRIAMQIFSDALKAGYVMSVVDVEGDEDTSTEFLHTAAEVWEVANTMDDATINFYQPSNPRPGVVANDYVGFVHLVFGNDGYDVVSDYTDNQEMEAILKEAEAISDQYA